MCRVLTFLCLMLAGYIHGVPRVVLVTGASQGIGRETAVLLASEPDKFKVYGTYFRTPVKQKAIPGVVFLPLDQADAHSIVRLVAEITSREKNRLDILVNNAGMAVLGPLEALSLESIQTQFQTNLIGPVMLMNQVLPVMRKNGYGRIINVSSIAGAVGFPMMDVYSGSKFGLEGVCAALAGYIGRMNDTADLDCRVIEPGYTRTGFRRNAVKVDTVPEALAGLWQNYLDMPDNKGTFSQGQSPRDVAAVIRNMINDRAGGAFRVQSNTRTTTWLQDVQHADATGDSVVIQSPPDKLYFPRSR